MARYLLYYTMICASFARCFSAPKVVALGATVTPGGIQLSGRKMGFLATCGSAPRSGFGRRQTEVNPFTSRGTVGRRILELAGRANKHGRVSMVASAFSTVTPTLKELARPAGAARLNFIDFNPGVPASGPGVLAPVVVMHGLLGSAKNFHGWGSKLVQSLEGQRRVFAVDMRNHGSSSHHDSMTYEDMTNDVLGFLADQGLSEAVLIGHSMGGKAAAMTALLHPEIVRGLMVLDIAPVSYPILRPESIQWLPEEDVRYIARNLTLVTFTGSSVVLLTRVDSTNWGETQKIIDAIRRMPLEGVGSRRDADERLARDIVDPALRAFAVTNLDKNSSGGWEWRVNIDVIHRSMGILAQFGTGSDSNKPGEARDGTQPFHGDAMFVAGGNSRYIRSPHLEQIRKLFPNFVLSTIKGSGHWVHADNPTETLRLAKSFLDRLELG